MNRNTNRALLMAVVGGYVLYLAYELLRNLLDGKTGAMSVPVMILAIVFFAGAGGGVLVYAWRIHREPADQDPVLVEEEKGKAAEGEDAAGAPPDSSGETEKRKTE